MGLNDPAVQENYVNGSSEVLYCHIHHLAFRPDERIYRDAFIRCPKGGEILVSWSDRVNGRYIDSENHEIEDEYWTWTQGGQA